MLRRRATNVNLLVFYLCFWMSSMYAAMEYGRRMERKELVCPKVQGEQVTAVVGEVCHYVKSYGRALVAKRRAL